MMKRLLISSASLAVALAFGPAYGSSHGHDEGKDSMEKDAPTMEAHGEEAMDETVDVEDLPPTAAGQESGDSMDSEMEDNMAIPPDETDPRTLEQDESDSGY
ncbi:hypothetical protein [Marinobacter sp. F4216]|uniref:hypothetical protein n=1 Tax=Marinobacter sp. F4216 TaxID=2874281 RepID=UPI001CC15792|nr:hypothetical protein [Marinobacter sp. F4216]MBZ2167409.1 hypothetical protein [Marinobacter sp. F4216]